ncbi:cadherin-like beta sandwich domain-containing protein [Geotalea toluenoxydans]
MSGSSTDARVYYGSTAAVSGGAGGVVIVDETAADSTPPTVSSTTPANGATGVTPNTSLVVTWNENINCATVGSADITMAGATIGTPTCTAPTNTATYPISGQANGTTYNYTIGGVSDVAGNTMATTSSRSYTTVAPLSSNANLSNLVLSSGTLTPVFASGTTSYTASVANSVTSITVTPTEADTTASTTVNGIAVNSGTASGPIALAVGDNTITVQVTAQDGTTTKTYTVIVNRAAAASTNANLSNLSLSAAALNPTFASGTISYTASVSNPVTSTTVTPTVEDPTATVKVNGTTVASGTASGSIALAVGSNTITTVVTAQDGTTTKTYSLVVTRAAAVNSTTAGALTSSNITSKTITVTAPFTGDDDGDNTCVIKWGTTTAYPNTATTARSGSSYIANLTNLTESTTYYFQATFTDPDGRTPANGIVTGSFATIAYVNPLMHSAANLDPTNAKGYGNWGAGKDCTWCHTSGTTNVKQVAQQIATPTGTRNVTFTRMTSTVTAAMDLLGNDQRSTLTRSTNICEVCHHQTNFHQYSSSVKTVGKSVTSNDHYNRAECIKCHPHSKGFKGNGHNVPLYATSAGHTDCSSGIGCHNNSDPGATYPTASTPPDCRACHTKGDPLTANIACGSCHGAAGGNGEPNGTVYPDITGSHPVHTAATVCTTCHNIGGTGGNADHGKGNRGANLAVVNLDSALGFAANSCSNASCHGNVYSPTGSTPTPAWGSTGNGCSACHSVSIGATGPATGSHAKHGAFACTNCHAPGTTATSSPSVVDGHTDGNIDIVNVNYQPNVTKHPADNGYSNYNCTTTCHGSPYSSGAGTTPVWGSTGAGCGACHNGVGAFVAYSTPSTQSGPNTGSHSAHMNYGRYVCDECHTGAVSGTSGGAAHGDTDIDVTNQGYPTNVVKHPANSGYSTCTAACHITTTWGLNTLKCTDCHAAAITRTKGRPGKQLAAVTAEFGKTYGHKKTGRTAVADADCIVCHLEGNYTSQKTSKYHADGNIDLRDPDVQGEAPITNIAGGAFTFQRFSTSYAAGSRTTTVNETIANVVTQKFCLKCHDNNGATNTTARSNNGGTGTQYMPFGGILLGTNYTAANGATGPTGTQGLVDVKAQFATANSSFHPVLGPRKAGYPTTNRLAAPYNNFTRTAGTIANSVIMNCFDCHNQTSTTPIGGLTLRTVVAHGGAQTIRGTATTSGTTLSATNGVKLCIVCHTGYDTNTAANHASGSAFTSSANGGMTNYFRYACNCCHASNYDTAVVRPVRAMDVHGVNVLPTTGTKSVRWAGTSTGTPATVNARPYAFIRNTTKLSDHSPKQIGGTTYSANCNMTGTNCNQGLKTYTVGGVY